MSNQKLAPGSSARTISAQPSSRTPSPTSCTRPERPWCARSPRCSNQLHPEPAAAHCCTSRREGRTIAVVDDFGRAAVRRWRLLGSELHGLVGRGVVRLPRPRRWTVEDLHPWPWPCCWIDGHHGDPGYPRRASIHVAKSALAVNRLDSLRQHRIDCVLLNCRKPLGTNRVCLGGIHCVQIGQVPSNGRLSRRFDRRRRGCV